MPSNTRAADPYDAPFGSVVPTEAPRLRDDFDLPKKSQAADPDVTLRDKSSTVSTSMWDMISTIIMMIVIIRRSQAQSEHGGAVLGGSVQKAQR